MARYRSKLRSAALSLLRSGAFLVSACSIVSGSCTPLIVGRSGRHIYVASNTVDTDGNGRCKLHFSETAVVMWATQVTSVKIGFPDGHDLLVDRQAALESLLQGNHQSIEDLQELIVLESETRIKEILRLYQYQPFLQAKIAGELMAEYVLVGKDRHGFVGTRAFILAVSQPREGSFEVRSITKPLHNGEVIDYSQGEITYLNGTGRSNVIANMLVRLQQHALRASAFQNQAFAPPFVIMDVTSHSKSYLYGPGSCPAV